MNHEHETSSTHRRKIVTPLRVGGLIAVGALALAACGGGGGKPAAGTDMAGMVMPANPGNTTHASTPVATNAVHIKNFAFSPATITVKAGATVTWTNDDAIEHDVTFDDGGIGSGGLNQNDTFSHAFATAGTYHYICSIHPFMHGTVIVTP